MSPLYNSTYILSLMQGILFVFRNPSERMLIKVSLVAHNIKYSDYSKPNIVYWEQMV